MLGPGEWDPADHEGWDGVALTRPRYTMPNTRSISRAERRGGGVSAVVISVRSARLQRVFRNATKLHCTEFRKRNAASSRREAEPTTRSRNEVESAVRQATIELLAESCRQYSCNLITASCRSHAEPLQPTMSISEIFRPFTWA